MDWRTFWNEDHAIYVSARHRALHARLVADGILANLPEGQTRVLDWGCGEAEAADAVASHCAQLFLYDSAPRVRANLSRRYAAVPSIVVLDETALGDLPDGTLDCIAIVSVLQYLSRDVFAGVLDMLRPKLAAGGRIVIGDVVPRGLSPLVDARALLAFAWRGGFFRDAVLGLLRTFFSRYRTLRAELGLTQWSEAELLTVLAARGFDARRVPDNVGHNPARMTFVGTRSR